MLIKMLGWLAGFRLVEKTDTHAVVKLPRWARGDKVVGVVTRNLTADAAVQGRELKVTRGYRLLRIEKVRQS